MELDKGKDEGGIKRERERERERKRGNDWFEKFEKFCWTGKLDCQLVTSLTMRPVQWCTVRLGAKERRGSSAACMRSYFFKF